MRKQIRKVGSEVVFNLTMKVTLKQGNILTNDKNKKKLIEKNHWKSLDLKRIKRIQMLMFSLLMMQSKIPL